jgi:predicted RNA-binding Zn-ribbon protein involved in translation (DUF1610 family)
MNTTAVKAADNIIMNHQTVNVGSGSYSEYHWNLTSLTGLYGNYSVDANQGCSFFICDSANFQIWAANPGGNQSFTRYDYFDDQHGGNWCFLIWHTDIWYFVFDNTYNLTSGKTVHATISQDLTGPTIEISSPSNLHHYNASDIIWLNASSADANFYAGFPDGINSMGVSVKDASGNVVPIDEYYQYSEGGSSSIAVDWHTPTTLVTGYYTITFSSWDAAHNPSTSSEQVWIQNNLNPTIDQPSAISFTKGATGNTVTWHPLSPYNTPNNYTISIDGVQVGSYSWNGSSLVYDVDGLPVGTHTVTCTVYDVYGHSASSTVTVTVQVATPPLIAPADYTFTAVVGIAIIAIGVFVAVAVRRARTETGWHWPITREEEPAAPPSRPLDTCNHCGAVVLMPESKFCWNCGTSLRVDSVVTAPSVKGTGRPLRKKCMVCDFRLNSADEIVHCPHCGNAAHRDHLLEWLHVNRSCPICRNHLDENELKTQLEKHPHRRTESHSSS